MHETAAIVCRALGQAEDRVTAGAGMGLGARMVEISDTEVTKQNPNTKLFIFVAIS